MKTVNKKTNYSFLIICLMVVLLPIIVLAIGYTTINNEESSKYEYYLSPCGLPSFGYNYQDYTLLDEFSFDIDEDGAIEDLFITAGITSGIFTFVITAVSNDEIEYQDCFTADYGDVFFKIDDNHLQLVLNVPNYDNEDDITYSTLYYHVYIENQHIMVNNINRVIGGEDVK